jgi:hypothetical protein
MIILVNFKPGKAGCQINQKIINKKTISKIRKGLAALYICQGKCNLLVRAPRPQSRPKDHEQKTKSACWCFFPSASTEQTPKT